MCSVLPKKPFNLYSYTRVDNHDIWGRSLTMRDRDQIQQTKASGRKREKTTSNKQNSMKKDPSEREKKITFRNCMIAEVKNYPTERLDGNFQDLAPRKQSLERQAQHLACLWPQHPALSRCYMCCCYRHSEFRSFQPRRTRKKVYMTRECWTTVDVWFLALCVKQTFNLLYSSAALETSWVTLSQWAWRM